ncbi:F-box-like-domain-containing protein [Dipodascopsis uninucleata]
MELPQELLLPIFGQLNLADLGRCAQVCRKWYDVANDRSLWNAVDLSNCKPKELAGTAEESSLLTNICRFTCHLKICNPQYLIGDDVVPLLEALSDSLSILPLLELCLENISQLDSGVTARMLRQLPARLMVLSLKGTLSTDEVLVNGLFTNRCLCSNLEHLNISYCAFGNFGVVQIPHAVPGLRSLALAGNLNVGGQDLRELFASLTTALIALDIRFIVGIEPAWLLSALKRIHSVLSVDVRGCDTFTLKHITVMNRISPRTYVHHSAVLEDETEDAYKQYVSLIASAPIII